MTNLRKMALRALVAIVMGSMLAGCLPIGFRGSSLSIIGAPAFAGH